MRLRPTLAPLRLRGALAALLVLAFAPAAVAAAPKAPRAAPGPPTLAVAYFDNNSGDESLTPLSRGLADMLITDLSAVSELRVVERSRLNAVLDELTLSKSAFIDPKTAQKLGHGLAAQYILTGGFVVAGDTLRIDARLVKVETGEVAASQQVAGDKTDFFSMEKELVNLMVNALGLELGFKERTALRRNATESYDAWQHYSVGLYALDTGDSAGAAEAFRAALGADPRYQAAKDATERMRVLITRSEEAQSSVVDALVRGLDPKAPSFGQDVMQIFQGLGQDSPSMTRRVALIRWLVEHDLARPRVASRWRRPSSWGSSRASSPTRARTSSWPAPASM